MNKIFDLSNFKKYIIKNKEVFLFIFLSFLLYFLFYKNIFNSQFNFWNSDATIKMFPVRVFLYEKLSNYEYPFWTERVYLGYSLYQDIENGALNPVNLIFIFFLGPIWSLKFMHLLTFLLGSLSIFLLVKKLYPKTKFVLGSLITIVGFYFSFFQINHLIHMNIILVSMLLPIHLYFAYRYFEEKETKFLVYQILTFAYGILWGQPQISFFNLVGISLLIFFINKNWVYSLKYLFKLVLFSVLLTFFQLLPTFNVFIDSQRLNNIVKYSEFTNSPTVLFNNFFPFSLGYYQNFVGSQVSGAYSFVETYNYISVVSFVLILFYFVYGSKDRYFKLVTSIIYFYLIFTFLGNFFGTNLPIYSSFRYWTRGVFLSSFVILFCINFFLTANKKEIKPRFNDLLVVLGILIITYFFESKDYLNFLITNSFVYLRKYDILIWLVIGLLSTTTLYLFIKNRFGLTIFSFGLLFLIIFDLRYFASDFLPLRISRYRSETNFKTDSQCLYKRCLLENQKYNGYEFLLFKTYSPFGYSQFIEKEYVNFFDNNFKTNIEQSPRSENVRSNLDLDLIQNLGFQKILLADGKSYTFPDNELWIVRESLEGRFIKNHEGDYEFEVEVLEAREYSLNLKHSKNFEVFVNGNKSRLIKNDNFSKIFLEKGKNSVRIFYYPYDILQGFYIGFSILFVLLLSKYFIKKEVFIINFQKKEI